MVLISRPYPFQDDHSCQNKVKGIRYKVELDRPEPDRPELDRPDRTRATSAEQRLPIKDQGSRIMDHGSRIKDHGSWIMDQRSWIMEQGSRIKDPGSWTFGMNDHPGRDTDVISRPSKSTIKDLSFYIGLQRSNQGSSILDLVLA